MNYFLIGDEVYVPKHKIIGTITDKLYEHGNEEIMLRVIPKDNLSNIAYGNSMRYPMYVNYSTVRSLKTNELYQKRIEQTIPNIGDLNINNLLKKEDIIKGTKIKVVDNYMLERMFSYAFGNYLYTKLSLSYLLERGGILTGKSVVLPNDIIAVECEFPFGPYYVYIHSLQLIERINIFKRGWYKIWNNKFIKTIRNNRALTFASIWTVLMLIVVFVIIIKFRH